ncbi:Maf family protein [Brachybacterium saurashtrense]|uniref:Nucleoside triphosphate pyrophosphatase n=1 Tax=Brachybacterium saurashtrense TaxID=556288 RepID=A0A345YNR1_9MICO|nr:Maf family protein [Brachybacterium saurashtrense]AXK45563.1 septum formation inhibitor Maf [Brachybacterium saurashtrense]RRR21066.1 septum formation inhibitor Maf [Brachybacterium saurashtrense]
MTAPTPAADGAAHDPLLLLASASAGRRATLRAAGIEHATLPVDLDEEGILARARELAAESSEPAGTPTPAEEVLLLAREKALAATARSEGGYVVLGCDSMLELDGEVIGKPHTSERARERWRAMRGRTGVLHSGHWIVDDRDEADGGTGATFGATASCELTFAALSDEEIDAYVATGEPLGVAGGFTLDGRGGPFVERVQGDPHAVVGLSLPLLRRMLGEIGLGVHELWEEPAEDSAHGASPGPAAD